MTYLLTFLEGFASFISPCVLPMLPIYVSYFAGEDSNKTKAFTNSIGFVIGFSFVYIILSLIANRVGNVLIDLIKALKIVFGLLIILLGLNYMEILKLNIFNKAINLRIFNINHLNFIKSLIFGFLFAISLTPCVGTFLASALLLIANEESIYRGLLLIIFYCIGLGIPFIISSVLIDKLKTFFTTIKKNYKIIKLISGIILVIMGIYLIVSRR